MWSDFSGHDSLARLLLEREAALLMGDLSPSAGTEALTVAHDKTLARVYFLEQKVRRLEREQGHDHSTGVLPPRSAAPPDRGPAGLRREVDKLGLGPWEGHVSNVVPIRRGA